MNEGTGTTQTQADLDAERFRRFIDDNMRANPIETGILSRLYAAFEEAGNPITLIYDGEEDAPITSEREMFETAMNLDQCWLKPQSGGWVFIVLGNEWDAISDYTISHEETLAPVNKWIERHW